MKKIICEQCGKESSEGYVDIRDPLTEERVQVCFSCALENRDLQRALESDDAADNFF